MSEKLAPFFVYRRGPKGATLEEKVDPQEILSIGRDIDAELVQQSKLLWWVGDLVDEADYFLREAEENGGRKRYEVLLEVRGEEKKRTVDETKAEVELNEAVGAWDRVVLRSRSAHGKLKALYAAVQERGRMLQTLAANRRRELYGPEGKEHA
jgi:hypothetical protein